MQLRHATADDNPTIQRMVRGAGLDPTKIIWQNFIVAEVDGHIAGIGQIRHHRGCNELGSMVTLKSYRGQGIARAIIAELEKEAGYPLYLFCPAHRRTFYEQFGFRVAASRDIPSGLRVKYTLVQAARLFRIRILTMVKM